MTPEEVAQILQGPHAVPDSDDEEDHRDRMVHLVLHIAIVACSSCRHWQLTHAVIVS